MTNPIRLIIADDHPVVREGLAAILETQPDIDVLAEAVDGVEAVKLAVELGPDVMLMDLQMPNLDGIEATRKIREREAAQFGRRTTILALTANTLTDDRYACFEAGMDGFLVKPLDRDRLTEALAGLTAARHVPA